MQTISATAAGLLAEGAKLGVTIACSGVNGNRTLTASDIVKRSFYLDRNSSSGINIELGNAEAAEIGFLLENSDRRFDRYIFEGATLTVDLVIGAETLRLGVFTVDNAPKRAKAMKIVALDNMAKFNRAYATALTGTPTLGQLAADCCTSCGVTLNTTTFTNSTVAVNIPTGDITFHQVICWIAELAGTCAWIDSDGELNFSWYGENQGATEITLTSDQIVGLSMSESDIVVTGVMIRDSDSETLAGADGYVLVIDSNPLVIAANVNTMLTAIGSKIVGNRYRPFSWDALPMPHVWPMDELTIDLDDPIVTPADGMDIIPQASTSSLQTVVNGAGVSGADLFVAAVPDAICWVTNHRYTLNGISRLAGRGETTTEAGYASATPFTSVQKTSMVSLTKQVVAVMGLVADWITAGTLDADRIASQSITAEKIDVTDLGVGKLINLAAPSNQIALVASGSGQDAIFYSAISGYDPAKRMAIQTLGSTAVMLTAYVKPTGADHDVDGVTSFGMVHGDAGIYMSDQTKLDLVYMALGDKRLGIDSTGFYKSTDGGSTKTYF